MSAVSNDLKEAIKKVYLADVEAIRNLSEVATKLQSGGLSVPGNLTTSGNTTVNGDLTTKNIITSGNTSVTGNTNVTGNLTANNITSSGNTTINGKLLTPNSHTIECAGRQHITGSELLYLLHKNGVIVGKEGGGNGNLRVQGNANVGSLTIGGTTIDETHLQMLTGARAVSLKHVSGSWTNQMNHQWVHVGQDRHIVKWESGPANFAFIKN